jgi:hypothetical protein
MIRATLFILLLASCHHVHASEICTPDDMRTGSALTDAQNAKGNMCITAGRVLAKLVNDSGLPCMNVEGWIAYPERHWYFVTCLWLDTSYGTPPDRVQRHNNYQSINNQSFELME